MLEFLKWLCCYAESYTVYNNKLFYGGCYFENESHLWENKLHRKVLLQEAIEGINKGDGYLIFQDFFEIRIEHNHDNEFQKFCYLADYDTIDQAKELALKWIWEQETC